MIVIARRGPVECIVSGEGPAILALHGAMGGCDQSELLARAAVNSSEYRVVAVSRPGYLGTPLALGNTPEEQADLCAEVLDALGVGRAAVIAVSGGGQCALQFALRHPERCWGLVMVSACSAQLTAKIPFAFHLMKWIARVPWLVRAMRKKRTLDDPVGGALLAELQASTLDRMPQRLPGTENDIQNSRRPFDYPVEQIRVPALIVHGTADELVPYEMAVSLAERLPNAELLTLEDGEHISLFTHLDEIRGRVRSFLSACCEPASERRLGSSDQP